MPPKEVKKILVFRLDHLGDVVMSLPAIRAIHRHYPEAEIDVVLSEEQRDLFEDVREIRHIIPFQGNWYSNNKERKRDSFFKTLKTLFVLGKQLQQENYSFAIDLRGDLRVILIMWLAKIPLRFGFGITGGHFLLSLSGHYSIKAHQVKNQFKLLSQLKIAEEPSLKPEPIEYSHRRKEDFWQTYGKELPEITLPRIVIHPGAGYPSKRWPADKFQALIERIQKERLGHIVLIGTESEKKLLSIENTQNVTDLRGKTKLSELPILLDSCSVYIGNDSGPAHLAAPQGLELFVFFSGTNDRSIWHPWTHRLHMIYHDVPCSPCEATVCPLRHHDCMNQINFEAIYTPLKLYLSEAA